MKAYLFVIASTLGLLALGACRPSESDPEVARRSIGPGGGILTSTDSVLTIAVPPGALETELEFFIERTGEPPAVFGQAYLVLPSPELRFDMTVTYRGELPDDLSGVAVGAIDALDYQQGIGQWRPLPVLRVDGGNKLITGLDDGVSVFYGLLDEGSSQAPGEGSTGGSSETGDSSTAADPTNDPTNDPTLDDATMGDATLGDATMGDATMGDATTGGAGTTGSTGGSGDAVVSYAMDVEPVLTAGCGCHVAGAPEGLDLNDGYANLVDVASSQAPALDRIEPGTPEDSYLWHKINGTHLDVGGSDDAMPPPGGGLAAESIALIEEWILDGAQP